MLNITTNPAITYTYCLGVEVVYAHQGFYTLHECDKTKKQTNTTTKNKDKGGKTVTVTERLNICTL